MCVGVCVHVHVHVHVLSPECTRIVHSAVYVCCTCTVPLPGCQSRCGSSYTVGFGCSLINLNLVGFTQFLGFDLQPVFSGQH